MILCMNEIAWLAQKSSWPKADHQTLIAVAWAESKGNTEAIGTNPSYKDATKTSGWTDLSASQDLGLLQINNYWHAKNKMLAKGLDWRDPADNIELARLAWNEGKTWSKWTTYKNGAHLPFMRGAETALEAPLQPPIGDRTAWLEQQVSANQAHLVELRKMAGPLTALAQDVEEVRSHFAG